MTDLPTGARFSPAATRFRLHSPHAERVVLELDGPPRRSIEMYRDPEGAWSVSVPELSPGATYAFRVAGPWRPGEGLRFNSAKLLLDPWSLAVTGEPRWGSELLASTDPADPDRILDGRDDAHLMPRSVVVASPESPEPRPVGRPWSDTLLYEAHVRGMTMRHPEVEPALRGTYLGLTHPAILEHLRSLGVTAVELMPIQQFASERHLLASGRRNYWGYAPIAWLAPHAGYATAGDGRQVAECREMVRRLHRAGLEVILDVVLNHTAEGGLDGLRLAWSGIDPTIYRRPPGRPDRLLDLTGCGNTVDPRTAAARRILLAALRHWVESFGVDGFRLDLAPVLGRDPGTTFEPERSWFFRAVEGDPVLSGVKWIAEPWDLGPDGYCRGRFPTRFREWDDRFRDAARSFWLLGARREEHLAQLLGSSAGPDAGPGPERAVRYLASHDGNPLADVVSYDHKHNEANGEGNRDGHDGEIRSGHGAEGPTGDPAIRAARSRARRNLLLSLVLAPGVPMLAHGDELGRTQRGNNNAYCQDSELTWIDWDGVDRTWLSFVRRALAVRKRLAGYPRRLLDAAAAPVEAAASGPAVVLDLGAEWRALLNVSETPARFAPELAEGRIVVLASDDEAEEGDPARLPARTVRLLRLADARG